MSRDLCMYGWTPEWRKWFNSPPRRRQGERARLWRIRRVVRDAVQNLQATERAIIVGYYYDGLSVGRLADDLGLSANRVLVVHRRALANLRVRLTPFVRETFHLRTGRAEECPICAGSWRQIAEDILDQKTGEVTWGEIALRLERAVDWHAPSPQILITHHKKHRQFVPAIATEDE